MAKLNEAFPSKYLKATDLEGGPVVATIKLAALENIKDFNGNQVPKYVLYFSKALKPLPLNRTNFESVMDISGIDDSDDWGGTKVEVFATTTSMNGKTLDCVRLRKPGAAVKAKPAKASSNEKPDYNDEIPSFSEDEAA